MFFIYGDFDVTFSISGSHSGAAFLTSQAALNDFHSGLVTTMSWPSGAQTIAAYTDIRLATSKPYIGGVGLVNVQGLFEGTKTQLLSSDSSGHTVLSEQRLRYGQNAELGAWHLPMLTNGEMNLTLRIFNDVYGVAKIAASSTWGAGEIIPGHAIYLPTMLARQPAFSKTDPTAFTTQEAGSMFETFRKPAATPSATLGPFTTPDVKSGFYSSIDDGAGGKISLNALQDLFLKCRGMAICDIASAGKGAGVIKVGRGRVDQEFMQENWMLSRIQGAGGQISMDQPPKWSWQTSWRQSI